MFVVEVVVAVIADDVAFVAFVKISDELQVHKTYTSVTMSCLLALMCSILIA